VKLQMLLLLFMLCSSADSVHALHKQMKQGYDSSCCCMHTCLL
jgi:hypothetical protein